MNRCFNYFLLMPIVDKLPVLVREDLESATYEIFQMLIPKLVGLLRQVAQVQLSSGEPDRFLWRLTSNHEFSVKSAYLLQFAGRIERPPFQRAWKLWAPQKCKFFL